MLFHERRIAFQKQNNTRILFALFLVKKFEDDTAQMTTHYLAEMRMFTFEQTKFGPGVVDQYTIARNLSV